MSASAVLFERLWPAGPPARAHELLAAADLRGRAPADRPFVFLNMVCTVDGRAGLDGRSSALGGDGDLEMLLSLRESADAVLVGTGTVAAESYARLVGSPERRERRRAAGAAADPLAVLISRRLEVPWSAGLFADPAQPVLVYTGVPPVPPDPATAAAVEVVRLPDPSPAAVLADLRARGIRALLCEGGPRLNRALFSASAVDELFLTFAPLVTGDDAEPSIIAGGALPAHARLGLRWVLRHGPDLFLRYGAAAYIALA